MNDLAEIKDLLLRVLERLDGRPADPPRRFYTLEEASKLLEKSTYTLREWCRTGRVFAAKRRQARGGGEVWVLEADEFRRYRDEGLLPVDMARNADSWVEVTLSRRGS